MLREKLSRYLPFFREKKRPPLATAEIKPSVVDGNVSFSNIADNLISSGLFTNLERLQHPGGERNIPYSFITDGTQFSQHEIDDFRHFFHSVIRLAMPEQAVRFFGLQQVEVLEKNSPFYQSVAKLFEPNEHGEAMHIRLPSFKTPSNHPPSRFTYMIDSARYESQPIFNVRKKLIGTRQALARTNGQSNLFTHQETIDFHIYCFHKPEILLAMIMYFESVTLFLKNIESELEKRTAQSDPTITLNQLKFFREYFVGQVSIQNFIEDILHTIVFFHLYSTQSGFLHLAEYKKEKQLPDLDKKTIQASLNWAAYNKLFSHFLTNPRILMPKKAYDAVQLSCPARDFVLHSLRGDNAFTQMISSLRESQHDHEEIYQWLQLIKNGMGKYLSSRLHHYPEVGFWSLETFEQFEKKFKQKKE